MGLRNRTGGAASNAEAQHLVADYVAGLSRELGAMAKTNGLSTLAYLLEMARLEAETIARGFEKPARPRSAPGVEGS